MRSGNKMLVLAASTAALWCLAFTMPTAPAFAGPNDDAAKLKELEQAMKATPAADENLVKKPRTRAIVFDSAPQQAAAPAAAPSTGGTAQQAAAPAVAPSAAGTASAGSMVDCGAIPPNAKSTAVDFVINFRVNSSEIAPSSEHLLQQIAKVLALSPDRCVLVEGHTDASGNLDKNWALSKDRADAVVRFVTEKAGLDAKRLVAIGKGPSEPLPNLSPRDPKNRRVVFKVVD